MKHREEAIFVDNNHQYNFTGLNRNVSDYGALCDIPG